MGGARIYADADGAVVLEAAQGVRRFVTDGVHVWQAIPLGWWRICEELRPSGVPLRVADGADLLATIRREYRPDHVQPRPPSSWDGFLRWPTRADA
jgi:hypothetical protein